MAKKKNWKEDLEEITPIEEKEIPKKVYHRKCYCGFKLIEANFSFVLKKFYCPECCTELD